MTKYRLRRIGAFPTALVLSAAVVQAQGKKPLDKGELLKLSKDQGLKDRSNLIIDNFVRVYGISFFPTPATLRELKDAGVHPDVLKELQVPETYSRNLAVRICQFAKPRVLTDTERNFGQLLREYLSDAKLEYSIGQHWPLLRGIPFDPGVGPVECFDSDHLRLPTKSYVTVSGNMHGEAGRPLVDTVFTFYGSGNADARPLRETIRDLPVSTESAKKIVQEAMTSLERMIGTEVQAP